MNFVCIFVCKHIDGARVCACLVRARVCACVCICTYCCTCLLYICFCNRNSPLSWESMVVCPAKMAVRSFRSVPACPRLVRSIPTIPERLVPFRESRVSGASTLYLKGRFRTYQHLFSFRTHQKSLHI